MCSFKSALCLRDRVFVPDYDSHEDMLKELGIKDDYLNSSKTFVRVELSPEDGDKSSDPMGWKLKVDQDIRPDWFDPAVDKLRIKQAIADWCAAHVIKDGKREVKDGIWYATGSATVKAYNSATVKAYDSATVEAYNSATVYACDSATVRAYDSATVRACDIATVEACGNATVRAYVGATVKACDSATVKACDSATVRAYDSATVRAYDSATVRAYDSATVEACDSATVKACDIATVEACGNATVRAYVGATVKACDSATVKAYGNATVEAYGSATVILPKNFQTDKPVILSGEAVCVNHKTHTIRSAIKWTVETEEAST